MKTRSIFSVIIFIIYLSLVSILASQCRKSNRGLEVKNAAPIDNATAVNVFNNVFKAVHSLAWESSLLNGQQDTIQSNSNDNCIDSVFFSNNTDTFPNTVVIDYGISASSCTGSYNTRGMLRSVFSGQYGVSGTVVAIAFSNYEVDSLVVSGTMTITNQGYNTDSNYVFNISVSNAKIEFDSINIAWNCSRKYEWISGDTTDNIADDKFEVSGTSNGRTSNGNEFDVEIVNNLVYSMNCNWISQGIIDLDLGVSLSPRTVDYGSGTCDADAKVSYKNITYELEMR